MKRVDILEARCKRLKIILDDLGVLRPDKLEPYVLKGMLSLNDQRFLLGIPEPEESYTYALEKPPIGLRPDYIWIDERINEIDEAIARYGRAKIVIPIEWINERNELVKRLKDSED